jgi:hypothetical protein
MMRLLAALFIPIISYAAAGGAELARSVREVQLDSTECYRVHDLQINKDDLHLYFTDGYLIFGKPVNGARTTAVFTADVEAGDAELLLMPPTRSERRSLPTPGHQISTSILRPPSCCSATIPTTT